jgi:hypothetical protein
MNSSFNGGNSSDQEMSYPAMGPDNAGMGGDVESRDKAKVTYICGGKNN